ncbi:malonyl CoA-acyl carrier protein transacylase [Lysobacter enzymogenes]|uniref:ACP S-malonyltransferase n=1 Tax=Lysobacter enzymogenes TaxID=69 RepID=UPI0019CF7159|nr:ACP S-malonyltransferase [Lysobacter enzymogenes]MBN7138608.1 malonyl CoA-acyl carrier protein transacylase [Lysobacter enzymogenes]
MKTFVFPGQGSQAKGMGGELFERYPERVRQADAVLGYSIRQLCLDDPDDQLGRTQFTQPALYVVNALSYFARIDDGAAPPDFLAGHSLGEFDALMAAGCYDFETGLKLVKKRGALMGQVSGGAMAAVLNASKEQIEALLAEHGLDDVGLANYNTPSQIVISGPAEQLAKAEPLFRQGKMRFYPLNTSGAFHSKFMLPAREKFAKYLKTFKLAAPKIPVISNVTAREYEAGELAQTLSAQIASTVRWSESVQYLIELAGERGEEMTFEEIGHGDVLTRLVQTIKLQTRKPEPEAVQAAAAPPVAPAAAAAAEAVRGDAAGKVAAWNRAHPVGTRVRSLLIDRTDLETRSEALVLFGHRAAVYMKGYNGYFDLDEVVPA